ncbi:MAG: TRAP transporter TatT component family protein [Treponema sp.]
MKLQRYALLVITLYMLITSCSLKQAAFNSLADTVAPSPGTKKTAQKGDMLGAVTALTGEDDVELVADVFPTVLKTYEMLHLSNPKHRGLAIMTGSLYIMYANAFVQTPADYIPEIQFEKKNAQYLRAKKFYRRGAEYVLASLDTVYSGLGRITDPEAQEDWTALLKKCRIEDVESLYWAGSGFLGAFALDPMDTAALDTAVGALAMLERAAELDPGFNDGAIWEVLATFYAAAPEAMGGGLEKAENAYQQALALSEEKRPSVHILYAQSFCIPAQDAQGFDEALQKALAIDPETQPENKLAIAISRRKARWLQAHKEDFFL